METMEIIRLVFAVLLCVPLLILGGVCFGKLCDDVTGTGKKKRRKEEK